MISDPIGDMLIRIKNGYLARKQLVEVPYSKMKEEIAKILVKEGYLKNVKCQISNVKWKKSLVLTLKYEGKKPALEEVKQISKPGVRIYAKAGEIPKVKYGFGITIVSTSKGIMTDKEARKRNLGGEVICQVW
ncbi:MAG: 30S ribosomal protein S8 [Microgenomates group bacterium]